MRIAKNLSLDEETYAIAQEMQGDFSAFVRRMLRTPNVPDILQRCEEWEAIATSRKHLINQVNRYLVDVIAHGRRAAAMDYLITMGLIDDQGRELV
jgi:hypothetical protein